MVKKFLFRVQIVMRAMSSILKNLGYWAGDVADKLMEIRKNS